MDQIIGKDSGKKLWLTFLLKFLFSVIWLHATLEDILSIQISKLVPTHGINILTC